MLDPSSHLLAGTMACAMFIVASGVQFLLRSLPTRALPGVDSLATIAATGTLWLAVHASSAGLLIAAALLTGAGQGLGQLGGLMLIGRHVADMRRTEANAVLNIGGYLPAGLLAVSTGYAIEALGLPMSVTLFAIVLPASAAAFGISAFRMQAERDA